MAPVQALALLLAVSLAAGTSANSSEEFWSTCDAMTFLESLESCALPTGPRQVLVDTPQYVWGSEYKTSADTKPQDFVLVNQIHNNITLVIPPMYPAPRYSRQPRKFLRRGMTLDFSAVSGALPSWSKQGDYVRSFCSRDLQCVSSREEAFEYARRSLPSGNISLLFHSTPTTETTLPLTNLELIFRNQNAVVCHDLYYTFQVLACHSLREFTVFGVRSSRGSSTRYVVCHGDTSIWPPEHPAFSLLHVPYLTSGICHQENEKVVIFA